MSIPVVTQDQSSKRDVASFNTVVRLLAEFTAAHGDQNPPQNYVAPCGLKLGDRVSKERAIHNGSRSGGKVAHTATETAALDAAGMIWKAKRGRPSTSPVDRIATYIAETGDANPRTAATTKGGDPVGYLLRNMRRANERGDLAEDKRDELLALGVDLPAPGEKVDRHVSARAQYADAEWASKVAALDVWRRGNNGAWPTVDTRMVDFAIGQWLAEVRSSRRKGALAPEREACLDARGIEWDPKPGRKDYAGSFGLRLACLDAFAETHGHASPASDYKCAHAACLFQDLGQWVHRARKKYKNGKMLRTHQAALEDRGVEWDASHNACR